MFHINYETFCMYVYINEVYESQMDFFFEFYMQYILDLKLNIFQLMFSEVQLIFSDF